MTDGPPRGRAAELGRFLEIQNLGLNLPFALAFLLVAAGGLPSVVKLGLILLAFVAARNAGHSFNRWADRGYDAANPRTRDRALVTGRYRPNFALALATVSGALLVVAAWLLNPLAFGLSFVALALIFGYSYTKRFTALTTPFLGLVEAIVPVAVFIAYDGFVPLAALVAGAGMLLWGTAFESIHSLGDLEVDARLGLRSLPLRLGSRATQRLVLLLHLGAVASLGIFGLLTSLRLPYFAGLGAMAAVVVALDARLGAGSNASARAFRRHFLLGGLYLLGVVAALASPAAWPV